MELLTSTGADLSFVHLGITIEHLRNSISIFGFRIAFYDWLRYVSRYGGGFL